MATQDALSRTATRAAVGPAGRPKRAGRGSSALKGLRQLWNGIGEFFLFVVAVAKAMVRPPFQRRELVDQAWFVTTVSVLPTALVAIPFGAVIALQVGSISSQLGAASFTGSSAVVAIVREGAPLSAALMLAGAAGSAVAADLGARKIREEIDALQVLGIDPIHRLVVPRVFAGMTIGVLLTGFVMGVGIAGGYVFNVALQDGTPGVYIDSFQNLATMPDLYASLLKGLIFGGLAATVGCFKGLHAGGGPRGVGQAVNEAVVITFLALFAGNFAITTLYFQLFPEAVS